MSPNPPPFIPGGPIEDLLKGPLVIVSVLVALWFVNMGLTGWLAGRKGRDSGNWALIAFVLGPIALVAILAVARKEPTSEV